MSSPCDNCEERYCDICGEAQERRSKGQDYGRSRRKRIEEEGEEAAFLRSGDNTR